MSSKYCAIVDAYSSGNLFADEFNKRGYQCVHIQSTKDILPVYKASFKKKDFVQNIKHDGNIKKTLTKLKKYDLSCLFAGIESGVLLADQLSEILDFKTNGTKQSEARRDKFKMHEALRKKGLRALRHFKSKSLKDILQWSYYHKLQKVVLKPLNSAGTDSVYICSTPEEIKCAFACIHGKKNKLGLVNDEVLIQEYIVGEEYVVNTVSCDGKHLITDIWKYKKQIVDGSPIYDLEELMPFKGNIQKQLSSYVYNVLDALEIKYGPTHNEVMMTHHGVVLIETGARVCGDQVPKFCKSLIGPNQIDLTVDAYVNERQFFKHLKKGLNIKKYGFDVLLISPKSGKLRDLPLMEKVKQLPSYHNSVRLPKPNQYLHKTKDMFTGPGYISLMHQSKGVLWKDYAKIRNFEANGFYDFY